MKKLITILLLAISGIASAQTYQLNYPDIRIGSSNTGKISFKGSNLRFSNIPIGGDTDSVMTIVDGVVKKVPRSQFTISQVQNSLTPGSTTLAASVNAINGGLNKKQQDLKIINVVDYGAIGDNTTDNTTAFKNAIAAIPNGGTIFIPIGKFKISDSLVVQSYVHFKGEDRNTAQIIQTSASKSIFKVNDNKEFVYINDLFLDNSSGASTAPAIDFSGKNHDLSRLVILRFNTGIRLRKGTTPAYLNDLDILLCPGFGIDLDATGGAIVGVYINRVQCQINGVGFRMKGGVNAIVSNGLACRLNTGGFLAESDGSGAVPTTNWINNIDVDSNHEYGLKLLAGNNYFFAQPWASNPAPADGVGSFTYNWYIGSNVTNVTMSDYKSYNSGKNGIDIYGNKVTLTNSDIQNSGRATFDTYDGIVFNGQDAIFSKNRVWSDQINAQTRYGLNILSGSGNYKVSDNDFSGVYNGIKLNDAALSAARSILNNTGTDSYLPTKLTVNTAPVNNNDVARKLELDSKLPLSGGTLTGGLNGTSADFSATTSAPNFNFTDAAIYTESNTPSSLLGIFPSSNTAVKYNAAGIKSFINTTLQDASTAGSSISGSISIGGKITVATAPTNPTDVLRLTDLGNYATTTQLNTKQNLITLTTTSSPTSFNQALGALNIQPTDLSNYARLNATNTFSALQTFNSAARHGIISSVFSELTRTDGPGGFSYGTIALNKAFTNGSGTIASGAISVSNITSTRLWEMPDKSGVVALASDINAPSISTKTANYTVLLTDYTLVANTTSSAITFTLPTAASAYNASTGTGNVFSFKRNDSGTTNALTIQANGAELIDGTNTKVITSAYGGFTVQSTGTTWIIKM